MPELDEATFHALSERHRRELHVHCYRMLGSFDEAEDLVQETLLRAWRAVPRLRRPVMRKQLRCPRSPTRKRTSMPARRMRCGFATNMAPTVSV